MGNHIKCCVMGDCGACLINLGGFKDLRVKLLKLFFSSNLEGLKGTGQ